MRDQILQFPNQLSEGVKAVQGIKLDRTYNKIVICGMGGSIMPGMMLLTYKEQKNKGPGVPVVIHNNYDLPSDVGSDDLVVCISWSGTTEETISAFQAALKRGIKPFVITKGGKLGQLAKENNAPLVTLPDLPAQPRFSIGYMVGALFTVLGLEKELEFALDPVSLENAGKKLAEEIGSSGHNSAPCYTTPLIYTSYSWRKLGALWKANFNETAKTPAYWNYVPILAHDELAMYVRKGLPFHPIIFRDENDHPRYIRDLDAAIAILDKMEYNYSIVNLSASNNPLETTLNNYVLGLWTSFYLAKKIGIDPEKIELIEEYKKLKKL